jgi:hypothetical protein
MQDSASAATLPEGLPLLWSWRAEDAAFANETNADTSVVASALYEFVTVGGGVSANNGVYDDTVR